jgi:hypothetical protein
MKSLINWVKNLFSIEKPTPTPTLVEHDLDVDIEQLININAGEQILLENWSNK